MAGTAKLFIRSMGCVKSWEHLKELLKEEFNPKLNSQVIHRTLGSRNMRSDETFQQYFLHMKELALHGNIEDATLIE